MQQTENETVELIAMYAGQLRTLAVHCQMAISGDNTYGTPREVTRDMIRANDRIKELIASQEWESPL